MHASMQLNFDAARVFRTLTMPTTRLETHNRHEEGCNFDRFCNLKYTDKINLSVNCFRYRETVRMLYEGYKSSEGYKILEEKFLIIRIITLTSTLSN